MEDKERESLERGIEEIIKRCTDGAALVRNEGLDPMHAFMMIGAQAERVLGQFRQMFGTPRTMLEVGVEGDRYRPHPESYACAMNGCVPAQPCEIVAAVEA